LMDSSGSSAPIGTLDQRYPQATSISEAAPPCGHYLKRTLRCSALGISGIFTPQL